MPLFSFSVWFLSLFLSGWGSALLLTPLFDFSPAEDHLLSQLTNLLCLQAPKFMSRQSFIRSVPSFIAFLITLHNLRTEGGLTTSQSALHVCFFFSVYFIQHWSKVL